jgi:hypothetical protein
LRDEKAKLKQRLKYSNNTQQNKNKIFYLKEKMVSSFEIGIIKKK